MTLVSLSWPDLALERAPVARALVLSVLIHILVFVAVEWAAYAGWLKEDPFFGWRRRTAALPSLPQDLLRKTNTLVPSEDPPMLFVEVDPAAAEVEPPKDARYYSSVSSRAANPQPTKETATPKIDGQQTRIVKTFDTLRPQPAPTPVPITPTPVKPLPQADTPQPAAQAKTGVEAGDLTLGKPQPRPGKPAGEAETEQEATQPRERPRTLAQARQQKGLIAGERMKQEGGVQQRRVESSLDVKGTPFGAYDAEIVAAIQQRWYDLIDQRGIAPRSGYVVLEFHLHHDGKISHMRIAETTVGDFLAVLCQKAVEDPAPYRAWPSDMRRMNRGDVREVKFTFYYN